LRSITCDDVGEFRIEGAENAPQMAFPARLLMPFVEQLCLGGGKPSLIAVQESGTFVATLKAWNVNNMFTSERLRRRAVVIASPPGFIVVTDLTESPERFIWTLKVVNNTRQQDANVNGGAYA
jgi:hypothetical protein